jgi:ABC-2 type transport system permease protein
MLNPVLYMVNGFRYGFYGFSDVNITFSILMLGALCVIMGAVNLHFLNKGIGLKH